MRDRRHRVHGGGLLNAERIPMRTILGGLDLTSHCHVIEAELRRTSSSAYPTICGLRLD
jgi:hypothetical protein